MTTLPENGMAHVSSPYTVPETFKRLEAIVLARGLSILARIDHSWLLDCNFEGVSEPHIIENVSRLTL